MISREVWEAFSSAMAVQVAALIFLGLPRQAVACTFTAVSSSSDAYAALQSDGSVLTLGQSYDTSAVADDLASDVEQVVVGSHSFFAVWRFD
eukprot:Skav234289  [mRNA]  locus=scaffold2271:130505:133052:+ [translate_table: standard]